MKMQDQGCEDLSAHDLLMLQEENESADEQGQESEAQQKFLSLQLGCKRMMR